jgi:hypothetical protein
MISASIKIFNLNFKRLEDTNKKELINTTVTEKTEYQNLYFL